MWKNLATYLVNGGHEIQIRMQPSELVLFTPGLNRVNGLQPWSPQHTVVECVCIPRVVCTTAQGDSGGTQRTFYFYILNIKM